MSTTMTTVTLADLRNQPQNRPYSRSLRVKVVAVGEQRHYKDQTGDAKTCLNVGVADSTDMAKVAVYEPTKFPRFVEGNYLLIRNVITKPFGFVVTQQTRVCSSVPMPDIPVTSDSGAGSDPSPCSSGAAIEHISEITAKAACFCCWENLDGE